VGTSFGAEDGIGSLGDSDGVVDGLREGVGLAEDVVGDGAGDRVAVGETAADGEPLVPVLRAGAREQPLSRNAPTPRRSATLPVGVITTEVCARRPVLRPLRAPGVVRCRRREGSFP
jgi:hypothetical protein